jgi:hypothetical protein
MRNFSYTILRLYGAYMVLSWLVAVTTPFSMGMSFLNSTLFMMTAMVLLPGLICWFSAQKLSTWFALPGESGGGSVSFEQWEILGIRLLGLYFFIHGLTALAPALTSLLQGSQTTFYERKTTFDLWLPILSPLVAIVCGLTMALRASGLAGLIYRLRNAHLPKH